MKRDYKKYVKRRKEMANQSWKNKRTMGPLEAPLRTLCPEFFLKYEKRQSGLKKVFHKTKPVEFESRSNPIRFIR
jgi:hypothetical protein